MNVVFTDLADDEIENICKYADYDTLEALTKTNKQVHSVCRNLLKLKLVAYYMKYLEDAKRRYKGGRAFLFETTLGRSVEIRIFFEDQTLSYFATNTYKADDLTDFKAFETILGHMDGEIDDIVGEHAITEQLEGEIQRTKSYEKPRRDNLTECALDLISLFRDILQIPFRDLWYGANITEYEEYFRQHYDELAEYFKLY